MTWASDSDLIDSARSGSADSFARLMARYERLVFRVAYGYTNGREPALDVTQNVFLKVYRKLDTVQRAAAFKPWLMRITLNESLNWMRDQMRHDEHDELNHHAHVHPGSSPDEDLARAERRALLERSLFRLNPRHRLAVILRYFEEMPIRDIAQTLDCSEGVVKNILHRSLRRLRDHIGAARTDP